MSHSRHYEVSVILPFSDDEDVIGASVKRLAAHLREYGVSFEMLAVDEDSGDNSHAILALLRKHVPELRVIHAAGRGRGFSGGAQRAQGKVLWLVDPHAAVGPLAPFGRAYRRVERGERDAVVVKQRFVICHRTRCLAVIEGLRASSVTLPRRFARRAMSRRLAVETQAIGGAARKSFGGRGVPGRRRTFSGLLGVLASARTDRNRW